VPRKLLVTAWFLWARRNASDITNAFCHVSGMVAGTLVNGLKYKSTPEILTYKLLEDKSTPDKLTYKLLEDKSNYKSLKCQG
jgi:hypothetical protein